VTITDQKKNISDMPLERWDWCSNKIFHNRQCCWFHFEQEMYAPATSGRLAPEVEQQI